MTRNVSRILIKKIRNARISRIMATNIQVEGDQKNTDAEIIPKLYIIRKKHGVIDDSTISPNIRTDDSAHVVRRHTLQVRMLRSMRAQAGRTFTTESSASQIYFPELVFSVVPSFINIDYR